MNKIFFASVLAVTTISNAFSVAPKVIYGDDNRQEIFEASATHQAYAKGVATMVPSWALTKDISGPGLSKLAQITLREWNEMAQRAEAAKEASPAHYQRLEDALGKKEPKAILPYCEDTKYTNQPSPGMCSGFLIAPDLMLTAGHCVAVENFCKSYTWVFGFQMDPASKSAGLGIKPENIYKCKKVISSALNNLLGLDYGLFQLDRVVTSRVPVEIRTNDLIASGTELVVIGSPSGLPLKVAAGAKVRRNIHPFYFEANLDTFQGNSGSPVFNDKTGVVEGILVRGEEDFETKEGETCMRVKKCTDDGCMGESVSRITSIPELTLRSALHAASTSGNIAELAKIFKLQIWADIYGKDGVSALMKATAAGQVPAMKYLLINKADANLQDLQGNTPLHYLTSTLVSSATEALDVLIAAGAKLEVRNKAGDTPLIAAAKKKNMELVALLIKAGADKNAVDGSGKSLADMFSGMSDETVIMKLDDLGLSSSIQAVQVSLPI